MKNNKLINFYEHIDYNTYKDIQDIFLILGAGIGVPNDIFKNDILYVVSYMFYITYFKFLFSQNKYQTKDIIQIRELYQIFIKNYNKLNKIFDFNDPVQIYIMFNYLLSKGYLSKDKNFEFSNKYAKDLGDISSASVICGTAVCRHISMMLTDILNDYGIESSLLCVYLRQYKLKIEILKEQKYTKEELINWVNGNIDDEKNRTFVINTINELINEKGKKLGIPKKVLIDKNFLKAILGNHAITVAFKDDKKYFLDATLKSVYRGKEPPSRIIYDKECDATIKYYSSSIFFKSKVQSVKEHLSQAPLNITEEEEKIITEQTINICKNNIDIFEKFYDENSELYHDISSKMLRIRKGLF